MQGRSSWGRQFGYRNAQSTVLAPTGTIGLLMDCDTTGIEPDFALVKFKKLAGGGLLQDREPVSAGGPRSTWGTTEARAAARSLRTSAGRTRSWRQPQVNRRTLKEKGLSDADLAKVETAQFPRVFDLDSGVRARGFWAKTTYDPARRGHERGLAFAKGKGFSSFCEHLGFSPASRDRRGKPDVIVGRMTIEGAPYLKEAASYSVFDCANRCGKTGKFGTCAPMSHINMMAATQPFLSRSDLEDGEHAERRHGRG